MAELLYALIFRLRYTAIVAKRSRAAPPPSRDAASPCSPVTPRPTIPRPLPHCRVPRPLPRVATKSPHSRSDQSAVLRWAGPFTHPAFALPRRGRRANPPRFSDSQPKRLESVATSCRKLELVRRTLPVTLALPSCRLLSILTPPLGDTTVLDHIANHSSHL